MSNNTDQYSLFPEVFIKDRHAVCSSLDVAAHFGKRHGHVLRDIGRHLKECPAEFTESNFGLNEYQDSIGRTQANESKIGLVDQDKLNLKLSALEEFNGRNFAPVTYIDTKGESRPAYTLTRDGFALLAMSFTGSEATYWKIAYLEAFNRMETALAEAARREAELEGRLEAARKLAGNERAGLAEQVMLLLEEGVTQAGAARLLRVSRHVVYRLRRRFGFLANTSMGRTLPAGRG